MKISVKDFFSKCDQIHSFLRIWLNLLKKSLMENFIFVQWQMKHSYDFLDLIWTPYVRQNSVLCPLVQQIL